MFSSGEGSGRHRASQCAQGPRNRCYEWTDWGVQDWSGSEGQGLADLLELAVVGESALNAFMDTVRVATVDSNRNLFMVFILDRSISGQYLPPPLA